jgi:AraC family transcriptional activator of pobA
MSGTNTRTTSFFIRPITKSALYPENLQQEEMFQLFAFERSAGYHVVNENRIPLGTRSLHLVSPGQKQAFKSPGKVSGYHLGFTEEFVYVNTENKNLLFRMPFFSFEMPTVKLDAPAREFDLLLPLFQEMLREYSDKKMYYENILLSLLNILLLRCGRFSGKKDSAVRPDYTSMQMVAQFKGLIRQYYTKKHFAGFYANKLNQTSNYLNLVVKNVTGKKSTELIHDQIMLEAKRLLIHTKLSPKEVAFELGFQDQSYFTKFFKRHTGKKPLEWFAANK